MSLQRRGKAANGDSPLTAALPEKGFWAGYVDLLTFMQQVTWEDGSLRQTGTVMLFVEGGVWKCWLHDRDAALGCFLTGESIEQVLKRANEAVGQAGGDWRPDRKGGGKGR